MSQAAFEFESSMADVGEHTYTVGELADAINGALRRRFDDGVWVRGEIQGWNERGPHAYFRLVEQGDDGKAVLNVQFFAPSRVKLRPLLMRNSLRLADGLKVRIFGHLDYYAPSGQLGLKMSGIDPRFTLGELALERDQVLRRLTEAGLLERNRRLAMPVAPLRVGVVASLASAAWADFLHEIERSALAFHLRVVDVRVQGEFAAREVSAALRTLQRRRDLDVVVLVRGGGSRTELATFDHESIAMAIATSALPVLTGLGHEIDRSVADEVAHSALKTPTACAAALVERVLAYRQSTEAAWSAIQHRAELGVGVAGASRVVERADARVLAATTALRRAPRRLDPDERHLDAVAERVRLLDPVNTMARGWSITRTADGRVVRSVAALQPGDLIVTTVADGTAHSRVEETAP